MDACHSTSTKTAEQRFPGLPNRLGHNGPYFGAKHPVAQDCGKIEGHTDLFRNPETFETDLGRAAGRIALDRDDAEKAAIKLTETGIDDGGALDDAASALRVAVRYLADAALLAEVLDDRKTQRNQDQDRRNFLDLVAGKPRSAMSVMERLGEEASTNWRIAKLLDRLGEVCGVDRSKAWPFIDTGRMEEILRLSNGPTVDELKAMDGDELLDALQTLESQQGDIRKRITLVQALRHVAKA